MDRMKGLKKEFYILMKGETKSNIKYKSYLKPGSEADFSAFENQ